MKYYCEICGQELNHIPEDEPSRCFDEQRYDAPRVCSNECFDKLMGGE